MNCNEARAHLDTAFDSGTAGGADIEAHIEQCVRCQRYAARLQTLDAAFRQTAPPAPALAARILDTLHEESAPGRSFPKSSVAVVALVLCIASLAAGYFVPFPGEVNRGTVLRWMGEMPSTPSIDTFAAAFDPSAWQMLLSAAWDGIARTQHIFEAIAAILPRPGLYTGVLVALVILVLFNIAQSPGFHGTRGKFRH